MTSDEMLKTKAKPGYHWVNVAPLGEDPNWEMRVEVIDMGLLFGYDPDAFMAKQYK